MRSELMLIRNRDALATSDLRQKALDIIQAGIERVLPSNILRSALKYSPSELAIFAEPFPLRGRLFVIGGGKASGLMAQALEEITGAGNITAGAVNCKGGVYRTQRIQVNLAGHPVPDERGMRGVQQMLSLKQQHAIGEKDLVLCLISGGGSALMPCPAEGISLEDKQQVTRRLLSCGAEISEINCVRKHLSCTKGGRLGSYFSPAQVISLTLSDVVGNDLASIASGPTYPDPTTFADAWRVLQKYSLPPDLPANVLELMKKGLRGEIADTPKALDNCRSFIIGDNRLALEAMAQKASRLGLRPLIVSAEQKGDTAEMARSRAREILCGKYGGHNAILLGGETTPTLPPSPGQGGRNQHYIAASLPEMSRYPGSWLAASVGTDGSDYMADIAGALVDQDSMKEARSKGLDVQDYVKRFDSHSLLDKLGRSLIITGETGTNVGDVVLYLLN